MTATFTVLPCNSLQEGSELSSPGRDGIRGRRKLSGGCAGSHLSHRHKGRQDAAALTSDKAVAQPLCAPCLLPLLEAPSIKRDAAAVQGVHGLCRDGCILCSPACPGLEELILILVTLSGQLQQHCMSKLCSSCFMGQIIMTENTWQYKRSLNNSFWSWQYIAGQQLVRLHGLPANSCLCYRGTKRTDPDHALKPTKQIWQRWRRAAVLDHNLQDVQHLPVNMLRSWADPNAHMSDLTQNQP